MCISETHTDAANRTTRSAGSTTGPSWSVVASIHVRAARWQHFHEAAPSRVNATRRGAPSCRSRRVLATGAAGGMWASRPTRGRWSVQQRALQLLEPCRAAPSFLRSVHPWDPLARPSVHPRWLRGCCAPTPPADVTSAWEGPVATHGRLPRPSPASASLAHMYIP